MADTTPLQWIFELQDRMSGNALVMSKSLETVSKVLESVTSRLSEMEKRTAEASEKGGEHLKGFAAKFAIITEGFHLAFEAAEKFVEKLGELGMEFARDALKSAAWEQQNTIAFESLLGNAERAEAVMNGVKKFSLSTGVPLSEVADSYKALLMGGIKPINLPIIMQAATDVSARSGGRVQTGAVVQAFADIQSKGQLAGRSLMQFQGLLGDKGFDVLAKKLGIAGGGFRNVMRELNTAPVGAEKGIRALLETLAQAEGGTLGTATAKMAGTLPNMLEKLHTQWDLFLGRLSDTKAFQDILAIIGRVTALFDTNTDSGKKLAAQFDKITDSVHQFLEPLTKPGGLEAFVAHVEDLGTKALKTAAVVGGIVLAVKAVQTAMSLASAAMKVYEVVMAAAGAVSLAFAQIETVVAIGGWAALAPFALIGAAVLGVVAAVALAYEAFTHWDQIKAVLESVWATVEAWSKRVWTRFKQLGADLMQGLVDGIMGGLDMVGDAVGHVASDVVNRFKGMLGIHSPSTVMMGLGVNTAEGYQQGLERGNLSDSLTLAMPSAPPSLGGNSGGMRFELNQVFNINGGKEDGKALARELVALGAGDLQSALETFGHQMGTL